MWVTNSLSSCSDDEKGKKMWSKYLEREDSKIVGMLTKSTGSVAGLLGVAEQRNF